MAFNFSHIDVQLSRSFAVSTQDPKLVSEAKKLFECDAKRRPYKPGHHELIVSPGNAREQLTKYAAENGFDSRWLKAAKVVQLPAEPGTTITWVEN